MPQSHSDYDQSPPVQVSGLSIDEGDQEEEEDRLDQEKSDDDMSLSTSEADEGTFDQNVFF